MSNRNWIRGDGTKSSLLWRVLGGVVVVVALIWLFRPDLLPWGSTLNENETPKVATAVTKPVTQASAPVTAVASQAAPVASTPVQTALKTGDTKLLFDPTKPLPPNVTPLRPGAKAGQDKVAVKAAAKVKHEKKTASALRPPPNLNAPVVQAPPMATASAPVTAAPVKAQGAVTMLLPNPFPWSKPGANRCIAKNGCTPEWVISRSKWPKEKQQAILVKLKGAPDARIALRKGDVFDFMGFGKNAPLIEYNVVAAWSDTDRVEMASVWRLDDDESAVIWEYVVPDVCSNPSGRRVRKIVFAPPPVVPPDYSRFGVPLRGDCPEPETKPAS